MKTFSFILFLLLGSSLLFSQSSKNVTIYRIDPNSGERTEYGIERYNEQGDLLYRQTEPHCFYEYTYDQAGRLQTEGTYCFESFYNGDQHYSHSDSGYCKQGTLVGVEVHSCVKTNKAGQPLLEITNIKHLHLGWENQDTIQYRYNTKGQLIRKEEVHWNEGVESHSFTQYTYTPFDSLLIQVEYAAKDSVLSSIEYTFNKKQQRVKKIDKYGDYKTVYKYGQHQGQAVVRKVSYHHSAGAFRFEDFHYENGRISQRFEYAMQDGERILEGQYEYVYE